MRKALAFTVMVFILLPFLLTATQRHLSESASKPIGDYLSITFTTIDDGASAENGMTTSVYMYDIEKKEISDTVNSFPLLGTQYPIGIFCAERNRFYYANSENQIAECDLQTGSERLLTKDFWAINHLEVVGKQLFFIARIGNERPLKLGYIDLDTGDITLWHDDGDTSTWKISIDKQAGVIYISAFSEAADCYQTQIQTNNDFEYSDHTIYQTDLRFSKTTSLYTASHARIDSLMGSSHNSMLSFAEVHLFGEKRNVVRYFVDPETWTPIDIDIPFPINAGEAEFAKDGNGIYAVTSVYGGTQLVFYDFTTDEVTSIFAPEVDGYINNFEYVYFEKSN